MLNCQKIYKLRKSIHNLRKNFKKLFSKFFIILLQKIDTLIEEWFAKN